MTPIRRPTASLVGLVAATALAIGAGATVLLLPHDRPTALSSPAVTAAVPVESRDDVDERQVQLVPRTGSARMIVSPRPGVLTGLSCSAGGEISSGDVVATVDGAPVVALATTVPLWRALEAGDRGDDVRGLQSELTRSGASISVDGIFGAGTQRAVRAYLTARGVPMAATDPVPVDAVAWIPAPRVQTEGCPGVVGSRVDSGDELVRLPVELQSIRLDEPPLDASPGDRVVSVADVTVGITPEGMVTDPADLSRLAATREYAASRGQETPTISARWSLAEPVRVSVVPPGALVGLRDGTACLQPVDTSGTALSPVLVEVVGSQLGQSFVVPPDGVSVSSVTPHPDGGISCR